VNLSDLAPFRLR